MDLTNLAKEIEEFLSSHTEEYERLGKLGPDGCAWGFALQEPAVSGVVSLETNEDDLGFATVSFALSIMDGSKQSRDELIRLMRLNACFFDASLIATPPDDENGFAVMLSRKIPVEHFRLEDILPHIRSLAGQAEMFLLRSGETTN